MRTNINVVLDFLLDLYNQGLSYSSINSARSTLSNFTLVTDYVGNVGSHPLVSRFMKGIFNMRPPTPRYVCTWDARVVLNHLRSLSPLGSLTLKQLTLKLVMLLALLTAKRANEIGKLRVDKLHVSGNTVTFVIEDLLKTSKPGSVGGKVQLLAYPPDRRLCVKRLIQAYVERTADLRQDEMSFFLSYVKPHGRVGIDTIARWIRSVMAEAGIDTDQFKAHSTRSASVSAAKCSFVPINEIVGMAGWSNERTFRKYYDKPVDNDKFGTSLLDSV